MKVLLTGANGFVGQYVLAQLQASGVELVACGRTKPVGLAQEAFIAADLLTVTDMDALMQQAGATHLLHLAWFVEHGSFWDSPLNEAWAETTKKLVEAFCKAGGQHVTVAGTCAEYDWTAGVCVEGETKLQSLSRYSAAKQEAHWNVAEICEHYQISYAWGRIFLLYGAGESPKRLVPSLASVFSGQLEPFAVQGASERDFLHVADVAAGFVTLMQQEAHGAYNVSSGARVRVADVVTAIADILSGHAQTVLALEPEKEEKVPLLVGDNSRLTELGWQPRYGLEQGLRLTLGAAEEQAYGS